MAKYQWDIFISHAGEDKDAVARPLAKALTRAGLRVWFDEHTLALGDSLRRKINDGLSKSRHGLVILSPAFFAKEWPRRELDGLTSLEITNRKVILPIWHNVTADGVRKFSPVLADRFACTTGLGLPAVVSKVLIAVQSSAVKTPRGRKGRNSNTGKTTTAASANIAEERLELLRSIEALLYQDLDPYKVFDFHLMVKVNSAHMLARYAMTRFGLQNRSALLSLHCPRADFHPKTKVYVAGDPKVQRTAPKPQRPQPWHKYFHWVVYFPPTSSTSFEQLESYMESPALPHQLEAPLAYLHKVALQNVKTVRKAMNTCSRALPRSFPTVKSLHGLNEHWLWTVFVGYATDMSPAVKKVKGALRECYRNLI